MYSPKIPERLIPALYRLARSRHTPMTRVVAEALETYLIEQGVEREQLRVAGNRRAASGQQRPRS